MKKNWHLVRVLMLTSAVPNFYIELSFSQNSTQLIGQVALYTVLMGHLSLILRFLINSLCLGKHQYVPFTST